MEKEEEEKKRKWKLRQNCFLFLSFFLLAAATELRGGLLPNERTYVCTNGVRKPPPPLLHAQNLKFACERFRQQKARR